jgi:hypothetical protein
MTKNASATPLHLVLRAMDFEGRVIEPRYHLSPGTLTCAETVCTFNRASNYLVLAPRIGKL